MAISPNQITKLKNPTTFEKKLKSAENYIDSELTKRFDPENAFLEMYIDVGCFGNAVSDAILSKYSKNGWSVFVVGEQTPEDYFFSFCVSEESVENKKLPTSIGQVIKNEDGSFTIEFEKLIVENSSTFSNRFKSKK